MKVVRIQCQIPENVKQWPFFQKEEKLLHGHSHNFKLPNIGYLFKLHTNDLTGCSVIFCILFFSLVSFYAVCSIDKHSPLELNSLNEFETLSTYLLRMCCLVKPLCCTWGTKVSPFKRSFLCGIASIRQKKS